MSGPTVELVHHDKWGWMLVRGRETFYDTDRRMYTWETAEAAAQWLADNYPELTLSSLDKEDTMNIQMHERIVNWADRALDMDNRLHSLMSKADYEEWKLRTFPGGFSQYSWMAIARLCQSKLDELARRKERI